MKLGNSSAKFYVIKEFTGAHQQQAHCRLLGHEVAPRVYDYLEIGVRGTEAYKMEFLTPFTSYGPAVLRGVLDLLERFVWPRPAPDQRWDWLTPLYSWAETYWWLQEKIELVYPVQDDDSPWCMIHGDPTLANTMMRQGTNELVIADPLVPVPGGKIPWLSVVDLGKILQSVLGWEEAMGADITFFEGEGIDLLVGHREKDEQNQIWLWAAIHFARAIPYANRRGYVRLAEWAKNASVHASDMVGL